MHTLSAHLHAADCSIGQARGSTVHCMLRHLCAIGKGDLLTERSMRAWSIDSAILIVP